MTMAQPSQEWTSEQTSPQRPIRRYSKKGKNPINNLTLLASVGMLNVKNHDFGCRFEQANICLRVKCSSLVLFLTRDPLLCALNTFFWRVSRSLFSLKKEHGSMDYSLENFSCTSHKTCWTLYFERMRPGWKCLVTNLAPCLAKTKQSTSAQTLYTNCEALCWRRDDLGLLADTGPCGHWTLYSRIKHETMCLKAKAWPKLSNRIMIPSTPANLQQRLKKKRMKVLQSPDLTVWNAVEGAV